MNNFRSNKPSVNLREETAEDEPFLHALYASVRKEELDATGWDAERREAFLAMQFNAQRETYRTIFRQAQFAIITLDERPIGRIIVDRTHLEMRVVDMALLDEFRSRGIGTKLMHDLMAEAKAGDKPLRLRVHKGSRATHFYERLGFRKLDESGIHEQLEWREHD